MWFCRSRNAAGESIMPPASPAAPTVFVVDPDEAARMDLVRALSLRGHPAESFASWAEFEPRHQPARPGCLVLDVSDSPVEGLEFYRRLCGAGCRLPVIFMASHADIATVAAAMNSGAVDYLKKPLELEKLAERIEQALERDAASRRRQSALSAIEERISRLSSTDRETLELLLAGATNKVMASRLGVSQRAVELRRQRLMRRVGARSLAELFRLAITHSLLCTGDVPDVPVPPVPPVEC
jgi:FixJ family two-component response regulator